MIMTNAGSALMGIGLAAGEGRAVNAARAAVSCPLLEAGIEGARGILLSISGPSDIALHEVNEACELIAKAAHPEANIIFGTVIDDALGRRGPGHGGGRRLRPFRRRPSGARARSSTCGTRRDRGDERDRWRRSGRRRLRRPVLPQPELTGRSRQPSDRLGPPDPFGGAEILFGDRTGGVSAPPFDTANAGYSRGDDPAAVAENRRRIGAALGGPAADPEAWSCLHQVHGAEVHSADDTEAGPARRRGGCLRQPTTPTAPCSPSSPPTAAPSPSPPQG